MKIPFVQVQYFRSVIESSSLKTYVLAFHICLLAILAGEQLHAQDCSDVSDHILCAGSPSQSSTQPASPFSFGCLNVSQSSFYTFQTNSVASSNSITVALSNTGCSDFLGSDTIYVMVVQLTNGSDACDVANYSNPTCLGDSGSNFSLQLNNLLNEQEYLLIVGSNHDPNYGPCNFGVELSGDALELIAGVNPLRINLGDAAQLSVSGQDSGTAVQWTPAEFLNDPSSIDPLAMPDETTVFTVSGYVGDCPVSDMITVTVAPPLEIYNTFTPNSDGVNDFWKIGRIEKFPNCQVQVYDRWGQLVFKSIGYAQPWDGTNKGKNLPMAAYYYVIELNSLDVKIPPITGVISIVN